MNKNKSETKSWADLDVASVQRLAEWRDIALVYAVVMVVWGLYRLLFRLPVYFEEVILKGLVFGLPVWLMVRRYQWGWADLGITGRRLTLSVYGGLALGILLGIAGQAGHLIRYRGVLWSRGELTSEALGVFLILSLVTAFWEQLLFSGLFLRMVQDLVKEEWRQASVVTLLFVGLYVPALMFVQGLSGLNMLIAILLLFVLQLGNVILRLRFNNLIAPVLAQALWGVTVYLFR